MQKKVILTDTGTNKHSNLSVENVFRRCTVRPVNPHSRKRDRRHVSIQLDEITLIQPLFFTLHRSLRHSLDYGRTDTETLSEGFGPVPNLTDVNGHVWVFGGRGDGELTPKRQR